MFNNYVSLGRNCEVAFQFRRIFKKDYAHYFHWLVTPFDSLLEILGNDFEGAFAKENLVATDDPDMIVDRRYRMKYHSPFKKELGRDLSGPRFDALHAEALDKYRFLAERFRTLAGSGNKVAYFVKVDEADARSKAVALRDLLSGRYPGHDFQLVILQQAELAEADWGERRIANRYLERFAPFNRAGDGHVPSWDRVFAEFPLKPGALASAA